jgi:hypothetical protein
MDGVDEHIFSEEDPESEMYNLLFNIYRQDWSEANEELKYSQSEEVHKEGENDMEGVEGAEVIEGEELKEDVEDKIPVKSKYDCYLPDEEQKEELRELFGLDPKTSILSEIVPNKYTQSIGNIFYSNYL